MNAGGVNQTPEVEILRVVIEFPKGSINRSPFKRCDAFSSSLDCGCHGVPVLAPSLRRSPTRNPPLESRGSCLSLTLPLTWDSWEMVAQYIPRLTCRINQKRRRESKYSMLLYTVNMITKISNSLLSWYAGAGHNMALFLDLVWALARPLVRFLSWRHGDKILRHVDVGHGDLAPFGITMAPITWLPSSP